MIHGLYENILKFYCEENRIVNLKEIKNKYKNIDFGFGLCHTYFKI